MEKVFTTNKGTSLFMIDHGNEDISFKTDGKKEDIWKALKEDMCDPDFEIRNTAVILYATTKALGIDEQ